MAWSALASLVGPTIAALIALQWWRVQAIGKRKTEIAEATLIALTEARDALETARIPVAFKDDFSADELASGDDSIWQISPFALWHRRYDRHKETFERLRKQQILLRYYFEKDAQKPVDEFLDVIHSVRMAAKHGWRNEDQTDDPTLMSVVAAARQTVQGGHDDDISRRADKALRDLEAVLAPTLSDRPFDWLWRLTRLRRPSDVESR